MIKTVNSSFRDPDGFVFVSHSSIFRQINSSYQPHYETLFKSQLYHSLTQKKLLIPHQEIPPQQIFPQNIPPNLFKIIQPQLIPFVSYPYEWSFSQLKDAALLTLQIQKIALDHHMSLKDASSFNVQFLHAQPILIDTLSFEIYQDGQPWIAYRQFCQHFLAPLLLTVYQDIRLNKLLVSFLDGIPIDLASQLLPPSSYFKLTPLSHIHFHARAQKRYSQSKPKKKPYIRKNALSNMISHLKSAIQKLRWKPKSSEWASYYQNQSHYSQQALNHKIQLVSQWIKIIQPSSVWDFGANDGLFSRLASNLHFPTISFDIDPLAVENHYSHLKKQPHSTHHPLPLWLDVSNPSPAIGWQNHERSSLLQRRPLPKLCMALALFHHLAISCNLPFSKIVQFFQALTSQLIIEFVPKNDPQTQILLSHRKNIFPHYSQNHFENAFSSSFLIRKSCQIQHSHRLLYWMIPKK